MKARVLQRLKDNILLCHPPPVHATKGSLSQLLVEVGRYLQAQRGRVALSRGNRCDRSPFLSQLASIGLDIGILALRCLDRSKIKPLTGREIDRRELGLHAAAASCSSFASSSAVTAAMF